MGGCFSSPIEYVSIKIETDRGKTLNLTVDRETTISDLKRDIAALVRIWYSWLSYTAS